MIAWALLLLAAEPLQIEEQIDPAPRNWANLRAGGSTATRNGRPELCLELAPLAYLSIEGCGTGSGFLHREPAPELAHFRAKAKLYERRAPLGWLQFFAGAGFAELQVAEDEPGFSFGGTSASRAETSGPELSVGARGLVPVGAGFEAIVDLSFSLAYLRYAPLLARPMARAQPAASLSLGFGF